MAERTNSPCIYVLAGTNGAGKSSIGGAMLLAAGTEYFNPDEAARLIRSSNPSVTQADANSAAWQLGKRLLERAIAQRLQFAFETTLGGRTIAALLESALDTGIDVRIWYVGLTSPELHLARIRARVANGGHDIPEQAVRDRYDRSRFHVIRLLPRLTELRVYDNSAENDPKSGCRPNPKMLLHMSSGKIVSSCRLAATPQWAKPILAAALRVTR